MITSTLPDYGRYVLTGLGHQTLVFPDVMVAEIMLVDRSYLLNIPFFGSAILGVIQQQGNIIPLVSLRRALGEQNVLIPEKITVIRLSDFADDLTDELVGTGLVVDKVLSSVSAEQYTASLPARIASQGSSQTSSQVSSQIHIRIEHLLTQLPTHVWQPQRWQPQVG